MEWIIFKKQANSNIKNSIYDILNDKTIEPIELINLNLIRGGDGDGGERGSDIPLKLGK